MLALDALFLELAQSTQAHIEDRLGLDVAQLEALHQLLLGLVLKANDPNHLVQVEIGDQEAVEDLEPGFDLG